LAEYKKELDDAMRDVDFEFLDKSVTVLNKRTEEAEDYYTDILNQPFDFDIDEDYEFDADKIEYVKSKQELKERWRKSLKYETLVRLYNLAEEQMKPLSDCITWLKNKGRQLKKVIPLQ
jgi:carboxyl-terminal processing protease